MFDSIKNNNILTAKWKTGQTKDYKVAIKKVVIEKWAWYTSPLQKVQKYIIIAENQ